MFFLEWRDFTGGHFVGPVGTEQPRNTWKGENATVSVTDGMLMPAGAVVDTTPTGTLGWNVSTNKYMTNFGAPIVVASTWHNAPNTRDVVVWAYYEGTSTDDVTFMSSDGATTQSQTVAGVVGNYVIPFGRPIAILNSAQAATVYFPMQRNVAGTLTGELWTYALNNGASMAASAIGVLVVLPVRISVIERWREWIVGAQYGSNNLYWSEPGAFGTWPAGNFNPIGDNAPIKALIPFANQLYVGKETGWWVVTGELGGGETIRQLDAIVGPSSAFVAAVSSGILFDTPDFTASFKVQSGITTPTVNFTPAQTDVNTHCPVTVLDKLIAAGGGPQDFNDVTVPYPLPTFSWVLDENRWSKLTVPSFTNMTEFVWVKDYRHFRSAGTRYAWMYARGPQSGGGPGTVAKLWRWVPRLSDPEPSTSCTVELAEARRSVAAPTGGWEFSVRDAYVEVEIPPNATGSVGVDLQFRMVGVNSSHQGAQLSTLQTERRIAESFGDARTIIRFQFSPQTEWGTGVIPIITLAGCKLRRLYLRCDDQARV